MCWGWRGKPENGLGDYGWQLRRFNHASRADGYLLFFVSWFSGCFWSVGAA
ncbi:hypothetical protein GCWU000324_02142 [Kingella oralis ATCC 51147]|uniref:Uncharacterized protein n=1 Tax=Kingella oralis ATCC 51147 TaxID=629741 RepID=C4GJB9_9NEIS|nr:hypothetical protein GCWU000324_02142 [Kingella oralis ATCC 51147]